MELSAFSIFDMTILYSYGEQTLFFEGSQCFWGVPQHNYPLLGRTYCYSQYAPADTEEWTEECFFLIFVRLRLRPGFNYSPESWLSRQIMIRQAVMDYYEVKRSRRQPLTGTSATGDIVFLGHLCCFRWLKRRRIPLNRCGGGLPRRWSSMPVRWSHSQPIQT